MHRALVLVVIGLSSIACLREPNAIPPPEPACFDGAPRCEVDDDCGLNLNIACRSGCCVDADICFVDRDCREGAFCDTRRGRCRPLSECSDTANSSDCAEGELCVLTQDHFVCDDFVAGAEDCIVRPAVGVSNEPIPLEVLALDANSSPAAYGDVIWSSSNGAVTDDALITECAEGVCDVVVTAVTVRGAATCEAVVRVYGARPANATARFIVVDESNAPLDARVDALIDGAPVSVDTVDANAIVTGEIAFATVVADGRVTNTYLAPAGDIVVIAETVRDSTRATGVKGTINFDQVHTQGDIKLALTGLALPSSLLDVTRENVLGVDVPTNIELEGITEPGGDVVLLPSNLTMALGDNPIRGEFVALGTRGPIWSLGMQVPLAELGVAFVDSGVRFAALARTMLPLFAGRVDNTFVDVLPREGARASDVAAFAEWDLEERIVAPAVLAFVDVPLDVDNVQHDLVTAVLGRVPTRGFVVLGLGSQQLSFTPSHNGLEGSEVVVAALDVDLDTLDEVRVVIAPLDAPLPPFLPFLDATFDGVTFTSTNDPGASLYRVRFDGWNVWSTTPPSFDATEVGVSGAARAEAIRDESAISSRLVLRRTLFDVMASSFVRAS